MTIKFETDNAAFEEGTEEIHSILWGIIEAVDEGQESGTVHDSNGNTVGNWKL